ncbi:MAG TPA: alpha/beta hydrolase [Acidimicrobiales bacterium]|nr:alpha/beta hydrolase [Acidimicrobiales bacterium]
MTAEPLSEINHEELSVRLPDGRRLGYATYGDPQGDPVLYFHSVPGSRLSVLPALRDPDLGAWVIAPDRPGFGLSDFRPGRRLTDWPADVAALADALGVGRFYVVGESAGGAHAVVCAWALPDRVMAAASIAGGMVDSDEAFRHLPRQTRNMINVSRRAPWLMRGACMLGAVEARKSNQRVGRHLGRSAGHAPPADQELLQDEPVRAALIDGLIEAYRQGAGATVSEMSEIVAQPWPFDVAEVKVPLTLWHGAEDSHVPVDLAERIARRLAHGSLHVVPGEGHLVAQRHWPEILAELRAAARGSPAGPGDGSGPAGGGSPAH